MKFEPESPEMQDFKDPSRQVNPSVWENPDALMVIES